MKVGLVRHFEVIHPSKTFKFMTSEEFNQWQYGYDAADVKPNDVLIDKNEWQICYCSDLPRAVYTAEAIYDNEIIQTKLLREVEILSPFKSNIKLPFIVWTILSRIIWYFCHKPIDEKRAENFISDILHDDENNILIVSHGALMWYLRKAILSKGFTGPKFFKAKNGYLYVFEKNKINK